MAIRFTEYFMHNHKSVYLYCKEVDGELEGLNFDIHIQDSAQFDLKMCRTSEGHWTRVTQNIPDWVQEMISPIVNHLEDRISAKINDP